MNDLQIVYNSTPFRHEPEVTRIPSGVPLRDIVGQVAPEPDPAYHVQVVVNGEVWGPERYDETPPEGAHVLVQAVPHGGGDSNKQLRTVLMIGIVAASFYFPPLLGMHGAWAAVGMAAISVGGTLAVNALVPVSEPKLDAVGAPRSSPTYSLTGARNSAAPYGPIPIVYGQHRITPPLAGGQYTLTADKQTCEVDIPTIGGAATVGNIGNGSAAQYLSAAFCLGYGELVVQDIRLGETDINTITSPLSYENTTGDGSPINLTTYTNDVVQQNLAINIDQSFTLRTTEPNTDEIGLTILFPLGMFTTHKRGSDAGRIDPAWITLEIKVQESGGGAQTTFQRYVVDKIFGNPKRIGFKIKMPSAGTWDVSVRAASEIRDNQLWSGTSDSYGNNTCQWIAMRSISYTQPIGRTDVAALGIFMKATEELSGVLDDVNCLVQRKLQVYSGGAWGATISTRNPAWAFADVLRGPAARNPIPDSRIDGAALEAWATYCDAQGFKFDAVVDFETTQFELLRDICAAGRASLKYVDGIYSVVIDQERTTAIQHFTPRNSFNYSGRKLFADLPHALKVQFVNEESDYQRDERIVYDDGYNSGNATKFETIEHFGVTDKDAVWKRARYELAVAKLRPEIHQIDVDVENLICTRGDLVYLTHDVPLFGLGSGRITAFSGNPVTSITLDQGFTIGAQSYAAVLRGEDGTVYEVSASASQGDDITTFTIGGSIPSSNLKVGSLASIGESGLVTRELLVKDITHKSDLQASLVLVDHATPIYSSDTGSIPAYNSGISIPRTLTPPPAPIIYAAIATETQMSRGSAKVRTPAIRISWGLDAATTARLAGFEIQHRLSVDVTDSPPAPEPAWIDSGNVGPTVFDFLIANIVVDLSYDVRVRSVSDKGAVSAWVQKTGILVTGDDIAPDVPTGLTAAGGIRSITCNWSNADNDDIDVTEIWYSSTDDSATSVFGAMATFPGTAASIGGLAVNATYYTWARHKDTSGNYSPFNAVSGVSATTDLLDGGTEIDTGTLIADLFDTAQVTPVEIFNTLPTTGNFEGRTVLLTSDGKLYKYTSGAWSAIGGAESFAELTGQIDPTQIPADAISSDKIADAAVQNAQLALAAVQEANLQNAAVTNVKVANNAIDEVKIQDGAISSPKIEANAIVASKIAASAITTDKIAADAVIADKIAANSISATQLVITGQPNQIVLDTQLKDVNAWNPSGGTVGSNIFFQTGNTTARTELGAEYSVQIAVPNSANGNRTLAQSEWVNVKGGEQYRIRIRAYADGSANSDARVQLNFTNKDGSSDFSLFSNITLSSAQVSGGVVFDYLFTVPTNAYRVKPFFGVDGDPASAFGNYWFSDFTMERRGDGSLIVDGAITAAKVAANAIVADKIAAGAIVADKIGANAITSDKITANAITSGLIAAGAVNAAAVGTNQIVASSGNIANLVVTNAKIQNLTIGGEKIGDNEISDHATVTDNQTAGGSNVYSDSISISSSGSSDPIYVWCDGRLDNNTSNSFSFVALQINSSDVTTVGAAGANSSSYFTAHYTDLGTGTRTYRLRAYNQSNQDMALVILSAMQVKK